MPTPVLPTAESPNHGNATNARRRPCASEGLIRAARRGDADFVKAWLGEKLPVEGDEDGFTPLMAAASLGRAECVRILLPVCDAKARTGQQGITALMLAAEVGSLECAQALLPFSDVRAQDRAGGTALITAVICQLTKSSPDLVALLAKVSDMEQKDCDGCTALMVAGINNVSGALDILLPYANREQRQFALDKFVELGAWESADFVACRSESDLRERALAQAPGKLPQTLAMEETRILMREAQSAGLRASLDTAPRRRPRSL